MSLAVHDIRKKGISLKVLETILIVEEEKIAFDVLCNFMIYSALIIGS